MSRHPHKSLHVVGESELANQLVKRKANSYTVLEKREPARATLIFKN